MLKQVSSPSLKYSHSLVPAQIARNNPLIKNELGSILCTFSSALEILDKLLDAQGIELCLQHASHPCTFQKTLELTRSSLVVGSGK